MEDLFTKVPNSFLRFRLYLTGRVQESLFLEKGV